MIFPQGCRSSSKSRFHAWSVYGTTFGDALYLTSIHVVHANNTIPGLQHVSDGHGGSQSRGKSKTCG